MAQVEQVPSKSGSKVLAGLELSLQSHSTAWMYGLLVLGFILRIWRASTSYLNPDEALHFLAANRPTWEQTTGAMASISHPPLLILVLRLWRHLGTSELMLRMPSVLAGVAFCWFGYKWLRMLLPQPVAWVGYIFLLFLPSSIDVSVEVRQYALLLAFATASAYFLERAFHEQSWRLMLLSGLLLLLAISSHYSAFLFAAAMGIYAAVRLAVERPKPSFVGTWALTQAAALAVCAVFYVFHISRLRQFYPGMDATRGWMGGEYLGNSYFDPARSNALSFAFARTGGVFQYALGNAAAGDVAILVFLVGMLMIFRREGLARIRGWLRWTLLLLPFAINCAAALGRFYPYGGTRHSAFLLPFALAGVAVGVTCLCRFRAAPAVTAALAVALVCSVFPTRAGSYIPQHGDGRTNMTAAITFLHDRVPSDDLVFADMQSGMLLQHYLCEQRPIIPRRSGDFISFECAGHRVIALREFSFSPQNFAAKWNSLIMQYQVTRGQRIWLTQMGWSGGLGAAVDKLPGSHGAPIFFGDKIQFSPIIVGEGKAPASPSA